MRRALSLFYAADGRARQSFKIQNARPMFGVLVAKKTRTTPGPTHRPVSRFTACAGVLVALLLAADASAADASADGASADGATATLRIETPTGESAKVMLDGRALGQAPLRAEVAPGDHELQLVWSDGRRSARLAIHVEPGDSRTLRLAARTAATQGSISVLPGVAGAVVQVDGKHAGTGAVRVEVPPGRHHVVVLFADGTIARRTFQVRAGASVTLRLR